MIQRPRLAVLDLCRGGAMLAMALFHSTWDLVYFGWVSQDIARSAVFHGLGHIIASVFLLSSGLSLVLAHEHHFHIKAFFIRLMQISAAAAAISLATFYFMPEGMIVFGILHCLAVSSLIAIAFLRAPLWLIGPCAIAALLAPTVISEPLFNGTFVQWLGLGTFEPATYDWRPLFPWLGLVLIGLAIGRFLTSPAHEHHLTNIAQWTPPRLIKPLIITGRHGLLFYLLHQPILFGGLFLITSIIAPQPSADERAYMQACQQQCESRGHDQAYCLKTCSCVADGLKTSGLWVQGLSGGGFTPRQSQEMEQIAAQCMRADLPE